MVLPLIVFVTLHTGPAEHFEVFSKVLKREGFRVEIYASGKALETLQERAVPFAQKEEGAAARLAERCAGAHAVITDVGDLFCADLHRTLQGRHFAYYDNPELPEKYLQTARKVMEAASGVICANATLNASDLGVELPCLQLGYYPVERGEAIRERRAAEKGALRTQFFAEQGLVDQGQKLLVYVGSADSKALAFFLQVAEAAAGEPFVVEYRPHPRAGSSSLPEVPWFKLSKANSLDEVLVRADAVAYEQTSAGPLMGLAGIPTVQVSEELRADDLLLSTGVGRSAKTGKEFREFLAKLPEKIEGEEKILRALGYQKEWVSNLVEGLKIGCE